MDAAKLFTILCSIMLLIALLLSMTTLIILNHAVEETATWQRKAVSLLHALEDAKDVLSTPAPPDQSEDVAVDILKDDILVKEVDGTIGVYSADGYLIRKVNVRVSTLPREAREALKNGLHFASWREVLDLIEAYES